MSQTPQTNLVMNKNPLVDRKVSIRKLGEKTIGLRMVHARSDGDVNRGVTVSVSLVSTVRTFEGSLFPYTFASASGANMRWNCNIAYFSTVVQYSNSVLEQVVSNLTVQPELSNTLIEEALKFYLGCLGALEHHERERLFIDTSKVFNSLMFKPAGLKKIQGYGFNDFHPKTTRKIDFQVFKFLQFLPPINKWASLERKG